MYVKKHNNIKYICFYLEISTIIKLVYVAYRKSNQNKKNKKRNIAIQNTIRFFRRLFLQAIIKYYSCIVTRIYNNTVNGLRIFKNGSYKQQ
jgi:hypothetical protein